MVDTLKGSSLKSDDTWYDSMCAYEFKSWCWNKLSYEVDKILFPLKMQSDWSEVTYELGMLPFPFENGTIGT